MGACQGSCLAVLLGVCQGLCQDRVVRHSVERSTHSNKSQGCYLLTLALLASHGPSTLLTLVLEALRLQQHTPLGQALALLPLLALAACFTCHRSLPLAGQATLAPTLASWQCLGQPAEAPPCPLSPCPLQGLVLWLALVAVPACTSLRRIQRQCLATHAPAMRSLRLLASLCPRALVSVPLHSLSPVCRLHSRTSRRTLLPLTHLPLHQVLPPHLLPRSHLFQHQHPHWHLVIPLLPHLHLLRHKGLRRRTPYPRLAALSSAATAWPRPPCPLPPGDSSPLAPGLWLLRDLGARLRPQRQAPLRQALPQARLAHMLLLPPLPPPLLCPCTV